MSKKIVIALVGFPNVGKSMLINSISNSKLKVGNFTGVTVEKKSVTLSYEDFDVHIIDLPGLYSLNEFGEDEKVTRDFLLNESYDLILNVVDSTNLERNLRLSVELFELGKKMLIALNMSDEAKNSGISIDAEQLSNVVGVPCIEVSALTKAGIDQMFARAIDVSKFPYEPSKLVFSGEVEEEVDNIIAFFKAKNFNPKWIETLENDSLRQISLRLLESDKACYQAFHEEPIWLELHDVVVNARKHLYIHHDTEDEIEIFVEERAAIAKGLVAETTKFQTNTKKDVTEMIDSVLINKFLGIPIFLFFMWFLFQVTFEVGSIPMDLIDASFTTFGELVGRVIPYEGLRSLVVDGIIAGVGAVVMFLPNILILFVGIALLEGTGYMSRVAFMLDGFFHKFGLHGKSFIPLVTGFGCSVPAYMSARILKSRRDRLLTLFIIGFMSCGARLPIYVLFAAAFFDPSSAGNILFGIYLAGAIIGLFAAKVLKTFVFKGGDEPFVMEMPKYRMPSMKLLWHTVSSKALMYVKKAGTYILAAAILIWFASNYPKNELMVSHYEHEIERATSEEAKQKLSNELLQKQLEESYLGVIGKATEPFFEPIGLDWKMTVALETGLAAKEVVVATLGILYSLGEGADETSDGLAEMIRKNIPLDSAAAFIVFVMIYLPCLAASAVFTKEAGGIKYLGYLLLFTTLTAYVLAWVAYKIVGALI
ncbi:MAG: ferrous iron transport protein B [Thiovulaceae bacterium]|nr:ferrous iron transport protein B [Sulfurimonadaceae bacterium]